MRLIDKDKLIDEVTERHYSHASMRLLRDQPEVKAIPIDWLITKAKEMVLSQGKKFYSLLDLPIVYDLIEEWKKENELR